MPVVAVNLDGLCGQMVVWTPHLSVSVPGVMIRVDQYTFSFIKKLRLGPVVVVTGPPHPSYTDKTIFKCAIISAASPSTQRSGWSNARVKVNYEMDS